MPENVATGWLPVARPGAGGTTGVMTGLKPGDQVLVGFVGGSADAGVILGGMHNRSQTADPVPSGEFLIQRADTRVRVMEDGTVLVNTRTAPITVSSSIGEIEVSVSAAGSMIKMETDGTVSIAPGSGNKLFLGGIRGSGTFFDVVTTGGPSSRVVARV